MESESSSNKILIAIVVVLVVCVGALISWMAFSDTSDTSVSEEIELNDSSDDSDTDELVYDGDAPVYVTVYSHNESSWEYVVNTEEKYFQYREELIERAEVLNEYGIEWNWQTDQPVVEAMVKHEDQEGENVLEYLQTLGVHLDPHAHKNNYADIVYLMEEELGVTATGVIGGLIHVECGREHLNFLDFVSWHDQIELQSDGYVHGSDYPDARWKPTILSDPGMGGHYFDDYSSGVWRPGDEDDFYTDFPDSDIVYIGEGYPHDVTIIGEHHSSGAKVFAEDGTYIKELVAKIKSGELPTGTKDGSQFMYTASVHMRDKGTVTEGGGSVDTAAGIAQFMDEMQVLRGAGDVVFVDFEEAVRIWEEEYDSVPHYMNMESFSFYDDLEEEAFDYCKSTRK